VTINCLACDGFLGEVLFSIPDLPLVDSFCVSRQDALAVPRYSVDLCQCTICSTIQIASPPDTSDIYKNYIYESSSSPDLSDHFSSYAQCISSLATSLDTRILEVGANDGLLLQKLSDVGYTNMLGVDPSPQTAGIAIKGVEIINDFFSDTSVSDLEPKSIGLIIANNCFSHIPNLSDVLTLCASLLEPAGTVIVEVQSCLALLEGVVFDYIYHEHYFYHSAQSFEKLASMSGLEIYRIDLVPTKGGSYRIFLGHSGCHPIQSSVSFWKFREDLAGIHRHEAWALMTDYLSGIKSSLKSFIHCSGRSLIGYGASATGTVLMRYMDIEESVAAIVDDNVKRQGLFSPGTAIPIKPPSSLKSSDTCLMLAWRHAPFILPKINSMGLDYVVPLPQLTVSSSAL
jgi:SAM-dependent methyltransferase